ncbi:MAG TPA: phosphoheptose isomerase [Gemmatimonadota bacterium]|nr:phosphoheptose isomerase [Gemmatimonadota bacterium]
MTDSARALGGREAAGRDPIDIVKAALARRTAANASFFGAEAERTAALCHRMAERFARDGRLVALGRTPAACSDVSHVAVEFVHPVIVGKRALPALGLAAGSGSLRRQAELVLEPPDIVIAFGADDDASGETREALEVARERGCLTIAYGAAGAAWDFPVETPDPFVRQEIAETHYHVLRELVERVGVAEEPEEVA